MKKLMILISAGVLLASCSGEAEKKEDAITNDTAVAVKAPTTVLDETKVYPFMELKELYQKDWKGEEEGNASLDGKTVTVTGEISSRGSISAMVGSEIKVKGAKIEFRGSQFADPESGHDLEFVFPAEVAKDIEAMKVGTKVTIKGVIDQQQWYIESEDMKYTVLALKDCELVK